MSGSSLAPWAIGRDADFYLESLAKSVNCDPSSSSFELIQCLRSKSVEDLVKADFYDDDIYKTSFGPIIDGLLIPSDPISLMESINDSSHHLSYLHPMGKQQQSQSHSFPSTSPSSFSSSSSSTSIKNKPTSHSLLAGVTKTEMPFIFTDSEEKFGIEFSEEKRDSILYSLITSIVDYYQEVSFISSSSLSLSENFHFVNVNFMTIIISNEVF